MDQFLKAISALSQKERNLWLTIIRAIRAGQLDDLDIKKLTGFKTLYRVRKWSMRLIFRSIDGQYTIVRFGSRGDAYKSLKGYKE
jgi:mRNA-degrading endonuclease RelE of RelBE toxin-antitoxin system